MNVGLSECIQFRPVGAGDAGGAMALQFLADQLTLSKPGGADYAHHNTTVPPLCFEWGFTRTFPRNQDVAVK